MCTGRSPVAVSSMFTESMPTSAGRWLDEEGDGVVGEVRVAAGAVGVRAPVAVPAGAHDDGGAAQRPGPANASAPMAGPAASTTTPGTPATASSGRSAEVAAVGEAVERRVEVGAGVGDHVDAADLELGARRVALAGRPPG